jgi:hypothetical protein
MLDLKFVRDHLDLVEQALKNRQMEISLHEFRQRESAQWVLRQLDPRRCY